MALAIWTISSAMLRGCVDGGCSVILGWVRIQLCPCGRVRTPQPFLGPATMTESTQGQFCRQVRRRRWCNLTVAENTGGEIQGILGECALHRKLCSFAHDIIG